MFFELHASDNNQLSSDIVAKNLFGYLKHTIQVAKFYPQPSHFDLVVGLCLYDCDFQALGVHGDFNRTIHWDTVQSEMEY